MELLLLKAAIAALQADQVALHFLTRMGWLSAFFVLVHNLKPESQKTRKWFWIFGLCSFLAPVLFFSTNWLLEFFNFQASPIPTREAVLWGGLWVGGLILAAAWLRYGHPQLNAVLVRFKRGSALERNQKTDVREIEKFLPRPISFNPLKYTVGLENKKKFFIGLDENKKGVYVDYEDSVAAPHIQIVGSTGAGKGVSIGVLAAQFLAKGEAVFYMDPKDDEWAPHVLCHVAQQTGKPFHFINLNRPSGPQLNPFAGATEEEAFELFQAGLSLIDKGDASDFYGIADRREAQATAKIMASKNLNIAQAYAARIDILNDPKTGAEKFAGRLRELAETPSINAASGGIDLAKVIDEGGCVYVVGSMRNDITKTIQRVLLVRLLQLAERRDRINEDVRPICVVLDEVKYHLSRPALEGLGAARDKRLHIVLAHQSLADLRDCAKDLNPDAVEGAIVDGCTIKICYKVLNPITAEWLAAMSGAAQVDDETRKVKRNVAQAEIVLGERNIRQTERYFIDTNMLLNLPKRVAVVYGVGLAKFASIQPIKVAKTPEAIRFHVVEGSAAPSADDAISLDENIPTSASASISLD